MEGRKLRRNILMVGFGGFALFAAFMLIISEISLLVTFLGLLVVFPLIAFTIVSGANRAAKVDPEWKPGKNRWHA